MILTPKSVYAKYRKYSQKKVLIECDECKVQIEILYQNYHRGQVARDFNGLTYCTHCVGKINTTFVKGYAHPNKGRVFPQLQGKNAINWKGGKRTTKEGYVIVYVGTKNGQPFYDAEHRLVMAKHLGRPLTSNEIVHHIDGNKSNNNIENLVLFDNHKDHRSCHISLDKILLELSRKLYREGLIKFDFNTKSYFSVLEIEERLGIIDG